MLPTRSPSPAPPPSPSPARRALLTVTTLAAVGLALLGASGCAPIPKYRLNPGIKTEDIGEVRTTIISVMAWNDVLSSLQPGFKLDGAGALERVLPITRRESRSDRFGASFSSSSGVGAGFGTAAPDGGPPDATPPEITLGDATAPTEALGGVDPFLHYSSATALFQEVALLNQYVQNAAQLRDSVPYLVRLQLTHFTYDERLPADAYVDLDFSISPGSTAEDPDQQPLVLPLIASESLEQTQVDRVVEFALAGALARELSVGVAAGSSKASPAVRASRIRTLRAEFERVRASLGRDVDSTFLVGANGQSGVTAKLGASNGGKTDLSMVARNYYVTVLVMVPRRNLSGFRPRTLDEGEGDRSGGGGLSALETRPKITVSRGLRYHWDRRGGCPGSAPGSCKTETEVAVAAAALPPWWTFFMSACSNDKSSKDGLKFGDFDLSHVACRVVEPVSIIDDGKMSEVVFGAVKTARAANLSSVLYVNNRCLPRKEEWVPMRSVRLSFDSDAKLVRASFATLRQIVKKPEAEKQCEDLDFRVALFSGDPKYLPLPGAGPDSAWSNIVADRVVYRRVDEAQSPPFPNIAIHGATSLTIDGTGAGVATVILQPRSEGGLVPVSASAQGADLVSAQLVAADSNGVPLVPEKTSPAASEKDGLRLDRPGVWRLRFTNATPGQMITVTLLAAARDGKQGGTEKFTYSVYAAPSKTSTSVKAP